MARTSFENLRVYPLSGRLTEPDVNAARPLVDNLSPMLNSYPKLIGTRRKACPGPAQAPAQAAGTETTIQG